MPNVETQIALLTNRKHSKADLEAIAGQAMRRPILTGDDLITNLSSARITKMGLSEDIIKAFTLEQVGQFFRAAGVQVIKDQMTERRDINALLDLVKPVPTVHTDKDWEPFVKACNYLGLKANTYNSLTVADSIQIRNEARRLLLAEFLRKGNAPELEMIAKASKTTAREFWTEVQATLGGFGGYTQDVIDGMSAEDISKFKSYAAEDLFLLKIQRGEISSKALAIIANSSATDGTGLWGSLRALTGSDGVAIDGEIIKKLTVLTHIRDAAKSQISYQKVLASLNSPTASPGDLQIISRLSACGDGRDLLAAIQSQSPEILERLNIKKEDIISFNPAKVDEFCQKAGQAAYFQAIKKADYAGSDADLDKIVQKTMPSGKFFTNAGLEFSILPSDPVIQSAAVREIFLKALDNDNVAINIFVSIGTYHKISGSDFYSVYNTDAGGGETWLSKMFGNKADQFHITNPEITKLLNKEDIAIVSRKATTRAAEKALSGILNVKELLAFAALSKKSPADFVTQAEVATSLIANRVVNRALEGLQASDIEYICQTATTRGVILAIGKLKINIPEIRASLDTIAKAAGTIHSASDLKKLLTEKQWKDLGIDPSTAIDTLKPASVKTIVAKITSVIVEDINKEVDAFAPPKDGGGNYANKRMVFRKAYDLLAADPATSQTLASLSPQERADTLNIIKSSKNPFLIEQALKKLGFTDKLLAGNTVGIPTAVEYLANRIKDENQRLPLIDKIRHKGIAEHLKATGFGAARNSEELRKFNELINKINLVFYGPDEITPKRLARGVGNFDDELNALFTTANGAPDYLGIPPACNFGGRGYTTNTSDARDIQRHNLTVLELLKEQTQHPAFLEFMLTKDLAENGKWPKDVLELFQQDFIDNMNKGRAGYEVFKKIVGEHITTEKRFGPKVVTPEDFMSYEEFRSLSFDRRGLMKDPRDCVHAVGQLKKEVDSRFGKYKERDKDGLKIPDGGSLTDETHVLLDSLGGGLGKVATKSYVALLENLFNPALKQKATINANKWGIRLKHAASVAKAEIADYQVRLLEVEQRLAAFPTPAKRASGGNHFDNNPDILTETSSWRTSKKDAVDTLYSHHQRLQGIIQNLQRTIQEREIALGHLESLITKVDHAAKQSKTFCFKGGGTWDIDVNEPAYAANLAGSPTGSKGHVGSRTKAELPKYTEERNNIEPGTVRKHYCNATEAADAHTIYTTADKAHCDDSVHQGIFTENDQQNEFRVLKDADNPELQDRLVFDMMRHAFANLTEPPTKYEPIEILGDVSTQEGLDDICRAIAAARILMECQGMNFKVGKKWGIGGPEFDSPLLQVPSGFSVKASEADIRRCYDTMKEDPIIKKMLEAYNLGVDDPKFNQSKQAASKVAKMHLDQKKTAGEKTNISQAELQKKLTPTSTVVSSQTAKRQLDAITNDKTLVSDTTTIRPTKP